MNGSKIHIITFQYDFNQKSDKKISILMNRGFRTVPGTKLWRIV